MNLHAMVRNGITAVNPDETNILLQSVEPENEEGILHREYEKPFEVLVQWQPDVDALEHPDNYSATGITGIVYLHTTADYPVAGIARIPLARSGDFLKRDGTWWLVTSVEEDWSHVGWVKCRVTQQTEPPEGYDDT